MPDPTIKPDEPRRRRPARAVRPQAGGLFARRAQQRRDRLQDSAAETPPAVDPVDITPPPHRELPPLLRAFFKPSRSQAIIAAILMVVGMFSAMQYRVKASDASYSSTRREDLVQLLDTANEETRRLEAELQTLVDTRDKLKSGADSAKVAEAEAQKRLATLKILAGTSPASGSGIRLVIFDSRGKVTPELLLDAIQELRDAGAEVIEINDSVRVVASTWVAAGPGGALVADNKQVTRPIVIDAIGDPHALEEAARFRGGVVSQVQAPNVGGTVTISRPSVVQVTAVRELTVNQYARPS